jgi:hypothetical protein
MAVLPELSPQDLNLLQRAIGAALLDEKEAPTAKEMLKRLAARCKPVGEAFGTYMPGDFAAAMVHMDEESYEHRDSVIGRLRLLFRDDYLVHQGQKFKKDFPALPVNTWEGIAANADRTEGTSASQR